MNTTDMQAKTLGEIKSALKHWENAEMFSEMDTQTMIINMRYLVDVLDVKNNMLAKFIGGLDKIHDAVGVTHHSVKI